MLALPECDTHGGRLADLLRHFRAQEESMASTLQDLQVELEFWNREAVTRTATPHEVVLTLRRCADLQAECDLLATELVHVRMAVTGTDEELAEYERRRHGARRQTAIA